jgi:hypothetical protein
MNPLIANIEIDNNQLMVAVIGVIGILLGLYSKVRNWEQNIRTGGKVEIKQPLKITQEQALITKSEHADHCAFMERRVSALENRTDRIERKMETDKTEIIHAGQERLEELRAEIREVRKDLHAQPSQIVALLKNMKGLIPE